MDSVELEFFITIINHCSSNRVVCGKVRISKRNAGSYLICQSQSATRILCWSFHRRFIESSEESEMQEEDKTKERLISELHELRKRLAELGKDKGAPINAAELCRLAEKRVSENQMETDRSLTKEYTKKLLHELQVHQVELEMQNEELRQTQAEIEALRARYFDLYDLAPVGYFTLNEQGLILEANLTAATLLGTARNTLVKQPLTRFILYEDQDIYCRHRKQLFETGVPQVCELRMLSANAAPIWIQMDATAVQDAEGVPMCRTIVSDITERKRAEEAIRQQLNFQQILIDTIPSPIFYKDTEGRYLGCNSSFESFIGLCKADIIGKTVYEISPKDLAEIYHGADLALFREPGVQQYETCVQYADGNRHDVIFTKANFTDLEGNAAGLVGVMLDITERKRAEQELSRYRDHLEELVKERTAELARTNEQLTHQIEERRRAEEALKDASEKLKLFAYSVAHDLKSPAIGVYGLSKRLRKHAKDVLDEKGRNYCDQILKISEHIATLVDKVNVYMATKEARLSIERIDIGEILQMLKDEFSAQLSIRKIEWFKPEATVKISADRLSIVRVFRNLVDNSLKYGGEGMSKIWTGYEDSEDFHIFSFSDNGKGLKEEDSEKIFRAFERNETSRGVEGAGLGLTIVKEIAEQHSGKVWVEPRSNKGITFYISIAKNL